MQIEKEPCPLCLAGPADWVDDPHRKQDALCMALAAIRQVVGVGERPMLEGLPQEVALALASRWFDMDCAPRDREVLLLLSTGQEVVGHHERGALWRVGASCVRDMTAKPRNPDIQEALRWRPR